MPRSNYNRIHLQEKPKSMFGWVSACGMIEPKYKTDDFKIVDCRRCIKTIQYEMLKNKLI